MTKFKVGWGNPDTLRTSIHHTKCLKSQLKIKYILIWGKSKTQQPSNFFKKNFINISHYKTHAEMYTVALYKIVKDKKFLKNYIVLNSIQIYITPECIYSIPIAKSLYGLKKKIKDGSAFVTAQEQLKVP